jgi:hypothetical protein
MITELTLEEANELAKEHANLIGKPLPNPYSGLSITSITVEKNKKSKGFSVILSHDIYDNGWPEVTGFRCPQIDLLTYLKKPDFFNF